MKITIKYESKKEIQVHKNGYPYRIIRENWTTTKPDTNYEIWRCRFKGTQISVSHKNMCIMLRIRCHLKTTHKTIHLYKIIVAGKKNKKCRIR